MFKNILIVKVHLWSERGPGHRENRGTEHCGTAAACSTGIRVGDQIQRWLPGLLLRKTNSL